MDQLAQTGVNRRMDPRVEPANGWIDIDGLRYEVCDVSVSGVLVRPYAGGHRVGGSFSFQLHLRDASDQEVVIDGGGIVVRITPSEMAAQFFYLDSEQYPKFDAYLARLVEGPVSEAETSH